MGKTTQFRRENTRDQEQNNRSKKTGQDEGKITHGESIKINPGVQEIQPGRESYMVVDTGKLSEQTRLRDLSTITRRTRTGIKKP